MRRATTIPATRPTLCSRSPPANIGAYRVTESCGHITHFGDLSTNAEGVPGLTLLQRRELFVMVAQARRRALRRSKANALVPAKSVR